MDKSLRKNRADLLSLTLAMARHRHAIVTFTMLSDYLGWGRSLLSKRAKELESCGLAQVLRGKYGGVYLLVPPDRIRWQDVESHLGLDGPGEKPTERLCQPSECCLVCETLKQIPPPVSSRLGDETLEAVARCCPSLLRVTEPTVLGTADGEASP